MTQLVKKDSSWRTLRRKAVVGASSLALVAGMGVALAPAAAAADDPAAPTITVTPDAEISNQDSDATIKVEIKTGPKTTDALPASTAYQLSVGLPSDAKCANVTWGTPSGTGIPTPGDWADALTPNCTFTYNNAAGALAANTTYTWTFTVSVKEFTPAGPFTPASGVTGDVSVKFAINYGVASPATGTATSRLVDPYAPTFADSVAAPKYGSAYNVKLVANAGFNGTTATTYTVTGTPKKANGDWDTANNVTRTSSPATAADGKTHNYYSLNDTAGVDGFFFDVTSGQVVFGKIAAGAFTSRAVDNRTLADDYTWTVVASNGTGGWQSGTAQPGDPVPTLTANQVASPSFNLAVAFSDVASDSVFADAIGALSGPGIIKGYGDGSFGVHAQVTRGEFAAFANRLYQLKKNPAVDLNTVGGNCDSTAPSVFDDVANTNVFCNDVRTLAGLGVINGTTAKTFSPNAKVTRDQVVAFLYRLNSAIQNLQVGDAPQAETAFNDVPKSNFASGDINWGSANGIVNGRTATTFAPADYVLRQEAAAFIYRAGDALYGMF